MMNQIESRMNILRLHGMSRNWTALLETRRSMELSLSEGLELLLQAEIDERKDRRFDRLQKNAKFRYKASAEELLFDAARGMDKALISRLLTGEYIDKGLCVLITGASGCGKSFLGSALGHQACAQGRTVAYFNMQKLLLQMKLARIEGTINQLLDKLAKTNLLILDDFGLAKLERQQQLDFMELFEDRHAKNATIVVSQLPVASWYDIIGEPTIADAILDRIVHSAYRVELKGESLRKKR
jgi:DNA replication protein DnaC